MTLAWIAQRLEMGSVLKNTLRVINSDSAEKPPVLKSGLRSRMAWGNSQSAVS